MDEVCAQMVFLPYALRKSHERLVEERKKAAGRYIPAVFVTFRSRFAQAVASTALLAPDENLWCVHDPPGTGEIIWPNLRWRAWERRVRSVLMWTLFAILCTFYTIPVGIVQVR